VLLGWHEKRRPAVFDNLAVGLPNQVLFVFDSLVGGLPNEVLP
jgi:uncharacterized membrane protein YGL010W